MPRAFDVTPSSPDVRLSGSRTGEATFTVSNKLQRPVRVRATPQPEGQTQPAWLTVVDGAERELGADGTMLFTVRMVVPERIPPGTYGFHLLVSTVTNPDEEYAHGPVVTAEVKEAVAPRFPWWIVMLGVGLVVVGLGAFLLFKALKGTGLHDACEKPEDCGTELVCSPKKECLAALEGECRKGEDCISGACADRTCVNAAPGADCTATEACPENQKCVEFRPGAKACLLKPDEACTADLQCAGGFCRRSDRKCSRDDGKCTPETVANDCPPDIFVCSNNRCLLQDGQTCTDHALCASDFCSNGRCARCSAFCPVPLVCSRNQCVRRPPILTFPIELYKQKVFEGTRR